MKMKDESESDKMKKQRKKLEWHEKMEVAWKMQHKWKMNDDKNETRVAWENGSGMKNANENEHENVVTFKNERTAPVNRPAAGVIAMAGDTAWIEIAT